MLNSTMKPLIIYGNASTAYAAGQYFAQHHLCEVAAYTVDNNFISSPSFQGKPLIPFEDIQNVFAPEDHDMLIPLGYLRMNHLREERVNQAKLKGYQLQTYISPHSVIAKDIEIRENTLIYELAIVRANTTLGQNVIINAGANVGHDCKIGSHCFIAAGVVIGGKVNIGEYCVIGLGAILSPGISIASGSFIGAGTVATKDITESGLYYGNPAKKQPGSPIEACN